MLFDVQCIEHHTGSIGRPVLTVNSSRASFGSRDRSACLVNQTPEGFQMLPYDTESRDLKTRCSRKQIQG